MAPQSAVPDNPSFSRNLLMPDALARQRTLSTLLLPFAAAQLREDVVPTSGR